MIVADGTLDRSSVAMVLARLGSELTDWAASARHVEDAVLPAYSAAAPADVQCFDALVQHLDQMAAFVLRLSAAATDGADLGQADIERLAKPTTLAALKARLTGGDSPRLDAIALGEVELW